MRLLEPHHDELALVCRRIARSDSDGDDLLHEALLRAATKLGALGDEARFRPWLYRIVFSVHRSRARNGFWNRLVRGTRAPADVETQLVTEGEQERAYGARRAAAALATLPAVQREALVLFELQGHSVDDIATLQACSASAVKSRLSRARKRLRGYYQRRGIGLDPVPSPAAPGALSASDAARGHSS